MNYLNENIETLIQPENETEKAILNDPEFITGAMYGEPRHGHPEGKVIFHISEVLENVDKYALDKTDIRKWLRFIALIHDTFKYKVDRSKPKVGENHHGMFARHFAEKYTDDTMLLDIIELHDEAYNAWRKEFNSKSPYRANKLIYRLKYNIHLYLLFYRCDNETGDKTADNYEWFKNLVMDSLHERSQNEAH